VYQTLQHLQEYAELQVFCPLPAYPNWCRPAFDRRRDGLPSPLPDIPALYFAYPALPGVTRPLNGFTCAHYLVRLLRTSPPDIILNFWLYPAGYAAVSAGRKLGVPVIAGAIGSDLNAIGDPVSRWFTCKTLHGASQIIVKSRQLRQQALALGAEPEKVHVIVNGCDSGLFFVHNRNLVRPELNVPASAELVVFVGRIDRAKGTGELLAAAAALSAKRPQLRLVYVGDGPELPALQAKVHSAKLMDRVFFTGPCSAPDVARWLAAANLLALPSYAEGCPNVVLEALSCGRPVVATEVGGIPELVDRRCAVLVPPRDAGALAQALDAALSSPWDEREIANHFRRDWKEVAREVFAVCTAAS